LDRFSFVTYRLRDGNDLDAVFGEFTEVKLLLEGLPKETAVAVDDNKSERMLTIAARSIICWKTGRRSSVADAPASTNSATTS